MEEKNKKDYEAPTLTVVTFKVEKGYADSSGILRTLALSELLSATYGSQSLEERNVAASEWGGGSGWL